MPVWTPFLRNFVQISRKNAFRTPRWGGFGRPKCQNPGSRGAPRGAPPGREISRIFFSRKKKKKISKFFFPGPEFFLSGKKFQIPERKLCHPLSGMAERCHISDVAEQKYTFSEKISTPNINLMVDGSIGGSRGLATVFQNRVLQKGPPDRWSRYQDYILAHVGPIPWEWRRKVFFEKKHEKSSNLLENMVFLPVK